MLHVSVKGGTGAGRRKPPKQPKDWVCPSCSAELKRHWPKCPVCGEPRPE